MTRNAGKKNTLICLAILKILNAGNNFFQHCHVISKIRNVGKNLDQLLPKWLSTKQPKNFKIQENLLNKKEENLDKNFNKPKDLQVKKPIKQNNLQKIKLNKPRRQLKRLSNPHNLLLVQLCQEPNNLSLIRQKLLKTKWLVVNNMSKKKLLMQKIILSKKLKMQNSLLRIRHIKLRGILKEKPKIHKILLKKKHNKQKKNLVKLLRIFLRENKTSNNMQVKK